MKRFLLRMCVNWWADSESPDWLKAAIDRDENLQVCRDDWASLECELREAAPDWQTEARGARQSRLTTPQSLRVLRPVALSMFAAVVVCSVMILMSRSRHRDVASDQVAMLPIQEEVSALINACADTLPADSTLPRLPNEMQPMPIVQSSSQTLRQAVRLPVDQLAKGYGRAMAYLDRHLRISGAGE